MVLFLHRLLKCEMIWTKIDHCEMMSIFLKQRLLSIPTTDNAIVFYQHEHYNYHFYCDYLIFVLSKFYLSLLFHFLFICISLIGFNVSLSRW